MGLDSADGSEGTRMWGSTRLERDMATGCLGIVTGMCSGESGSSILRLERGCTVISRRNIVIRGCGMIISGKGEGDLVNYVLHIGAGSRYYWSYCLRFRNS